MARRQSQHHALARERRCGTQQMMRARMAAIAAAIHAAASATSQLSRAGIAAAAAAPNSGANSASSGG
ncbi:MAG: hypothetical protein R3C16_12730 [Hyphomonadaceae bacterium]